MVSPLDRPAITGATGFIGGHLSRHLAKLGHRPLLLSRQPRRTELLADVEGRVDWVEADVTDLPSIEKVLRSDRPTTVFHFAGTRGRQADGALACVETNVRGTVTVLTAAKATGIGRVVMVSSADVFGSQAAGPIREDAPVNPASVYAASSAAACLFAEAMHRTEGCPVVVLRLFSVYGPYQPVEMFVAQAVRAAVRNEPFEMSTGTQRRDLVYIEDVVRACVVAAETPSAEGGVFNIGSGEASRLRDVAECIWRLSDSRGELRVGARPAPPPESHDTWADLTLARERLGWRPNVRLEDGLRRTINWARKEY